MGLVDNYKYLLFKYLYNILNLNEIENKMNNDIKPLNIISTEGYDIISKYFFLKNNINIDKFTEEERQFFDYYFVKNVYEYNENELKKIEEFIKKTYEKLIFPDVPDEYIYYGPINDNFLCPRDSIVIGLYYDVVNENDFEIENQLVDIANYIQSNSSKKLGKKVAVLLFNQLSLDSEKSFSK